MIPSKDVKFVSQTLSSLCYLWVKHCKCELSLGMAGGYVIAKQTSLRCDGYGIVKCDGENYLCKKFCSTDPRTSKSVSLWLSFTQEKKFFFFFYFKGKVKKGRQTQSKSFFKEKKLKIKVYFSKHFTTDKYASLFGSDTRKSYLIKPSIALHGPGWPSMA